MGSERNILSLLVTTCFCIWLGCCPGQDSEGQDSPPSPALNGKVWEAKDGTILKLNRDAEGGAIVDGDTVRLIGLDASVRSIGIDTEELYRAPEDRKAAIEDFDLYAKTQRGDSLRPVKYGTPSGLAAKQFATVFFKGLERVLFVTDNDRQPRGYYHRYLGHLLVDRDQDGVFEKNFAVEIVRNGLSPYYTKYGYCKRFRKEFEAAEKEARENKMGIWNDGADAVRHYPDYEERLNWWYRRGRALERYDRLYSGKDSHYQMGLVSDIARLKKNLSESSEGLDVVLFGSIKRVSTPRAKGRVAIISHQDSRDVSVYWDVRKHKKGKHEDFAPFEGEFVYVEGTVIPNSSRVGFEFRISGTDAIGRE